MNSRTFCAAIVVVSAARLSPLAIVAAQSATPTVVPTARPQPMGPSEGEDDDDEDEDEDDDETTEPPGAPPAGAADSSVAVATDSEHVRRTGNAVDASAALSAREASELGAGAELDVVSRYVWRGRALSAGPAAQPSAWVSYADLSATLWMNVLLQGERPKHTISAIDPELSYACSWGRLQIEPSLVVYGVRDEVRSWTTAEAGLKLAYGWAPFDIVSIQSVDIDSQPGAYFASLGFQFRKRLARFEIGGFSDVGGANAIFNQTHWGKRSAALDLVELGVELRYAAAGALYFTSHAQTSTLLAPSLRRVPSEPTLLSAGVSVGAEF